MTMIEIIARVGLPSQDGPGRGMPSPISNRLTTLKAGSSIHIQATVLSTVGTMNGSSSNARTMFFMRKFWFIASARQSPPTIFSRVATRIDEGVNRDSPEHRVVEIGDEVLQSDKGPGLRHRSVHQAQEDAVAERVANEGRQKQQRQRHHQPAEHALPVEPGGERRWPPARRPRYPDQRL